MCVCVCMCASVWCVCVCKNARVRRRACRMRVCVRMCVCDQMCVCVRENAFVISPNREGMTRLKPVYRGDTPNRGAPRSLVVVVTLVRAMRIRV